MRIREGRQPVAARGLSWTGVSAARWSRGGAREELYLVDGSRLMTLHRQLKACIGSPDGDAEPHGASFLPLAIGAQLLGLGHGGSLPQ